MKNLILILSLLFTTGTYSQLLGGGSTINTNNNSHNIFINGQIVGQGSVAGIKIPKNECITVQVSGTGYITEIKKFCRQKGMPKMQKTEYITLARDDSFDATFSSDLANNDIIVNPRRGDLDEVWKNAVRLVIENFDALEVNDNDVNYLRTSWVVDTFDEFTIRTRLIARVSDEDPIEVRFKIVSERARGQVSPRDDERFRAWQRIMRKYEGLIEEIQSRL
jgi:hypothetical protein